MREFLRNNLQNVPRVPLPTTVQPSQEALEAEEWLRGAGRFPSSARLTPPAAPSDFTARVMARIESNEPMVAAQTVRQRNPVQTLRPLGIAGGAVGVSGLLVLASLAAAFVMAPGALVTLLNAIVGTFVSALLLLTPLLDAAAALAANNALMVGLTALVAGFALLWSHMHSPITQLAREA